MDDALLECCARKATHCRQCLYVTRSTVSLLSINQLGGRLVMPSTLFKTHCQRSLLAMQQNVFEIGTSSRLDMGARW